MHPGSGSRLISHILCYLAVRWERERQEIFGLSIEPWTDRQRGLRPWVVSQRYTRQNIGLDRLGIVTPLVQAGSRHGKLHALGLFTAVLVAWLASRDQFSGIFIVHGCHWLTPSLLVEHGLGLILFWKQIGQRSPFGFRLLLRIWNSGWGQALLSVADWLLSFRAGRSRGIHIVPLDACRRSEFILGCLPLVGRIFLAPNRLQK